MLFFDNERRNCDEVGKLGVQCVYTPGGMTERHWTEGLAEYAKHIRNHIDDNLYESPAVRRERAKERRTPSWGSRQDTVGDLAKAGGGEGESNGFGSGGFGSQGGEPTTGGLVELEDALKATRVGDRDGEL